jgi:hypothetical protein
VQLETVHRIDVEPLKIRAVIQRDVGFLRHDPDAPAVAHDVRTDVTRLTSASVAAKSGWSSTSGFVV